MKCSTRQLLGAAVIGLSAVSTFAGPITPGDLLIYRVGDGVGAITSSAAAVFVDEYTPAGTLVQSIAMPTAISAGTAALTATGSAPSEGMLTFNNGVLALAGYDANAGKSGVSGTSTTTSTGGGPIPRSIGIVGLNGVPITTTTTTAFTITNIRSAVAVSSVAGTSIYVDGGATGIVMLPLGGSGAGTAVSTTPIVNYRSINIFGGQLYVSDDTGTAIRIGTVGSGVPTTTGQSVASIPGFPGNTGSPYQFFFADLNPAIAGVDTLYVADDAAGILKYVSDGTNWSAAGTIGLASAAYRGLTGTVSPSGAVTLYATGAPTGSSSFASFQDSTSFGTTITSANTTFTPLTSAAANTAYRGIAVASIDFLSLSPTSSFTLASPDFVYVNSSGPFNYLGAPTPITPTAQGSIQLVNVGPESGTTVLLDLTGSATDVATAIANLMADGYNIVTPATDGSDTDAMVLFAYYNWANLLVRFPAPGAATDDYNAYFNFDFTASNVEVAEITAVPEPASLGLLAIGGIALLSRRRSKA